MYPDYNVDSEGVPKFSRTFREGVLKKTKCHGENPGPK